MIEYNRAEDIKDVYNEVFSLFSPLFLFFSCGGEFKL
jgi:hypothetical protein